METTTASKSFDGNSEKGYDITTGVVPVGGEVAEDSEDAEVFHSRNGVEFRTVGWIRAGIIFLKMTFAAGVLSIPYSMNTLGAVAGAIFIVFWGILNIYCACIQGNFRNKHRQVHTPADMGEILYGPIGREIAGFLYLWTWIICSGVSILGVSIAFNAISGGNTMCSVAWTAVSYLIVSTGASIRKLHNVGAIMWLGFICLFSAIMIVTIAVTIPDRPAAAPQTGPFDLGFHALAPAGTTFAAALSASLAIFSSSANTSGFIPVIAEMRRPQDFNKAVIVSLGFISCAYLAIATTVYAYAGQYVTSPALGSAGPLIKKISFGIGLPGMIAGTLLCVHVAAKYLFVRILRKSVHLQSNSKTHWITWLSCTYGCGAIAFILASAIPFFNSLVSLVGSLGFAQLALMLPAMLWFNMNPNSLKGNASSKAKWFGHAAIFALGVFVTVAGTYAVIDGIIVSYRNGTIGAAFSCADNSGTSGASS